MTRVLQFSVIIGALFATALLLTSVWMTKSASASAGTLPATLYSQNIVAASTTPGIVVATTTNCAARILSTASSSVMVQFTDAFGGTPNAAVGLWQAGSTTVAYDSNQYGCGAMRIFSFTTQQVTILLSL